LAPTVLGVAICVAAIVFGVLFEQVVLAQSAFKMTRLSRQLARAESVHEALLLQSAKLESPQRIETYARRRLGMVEPSSVSYIVARVPRSGGGSSIKRPAELPIGRAASSEAPLQGAP
jgi:cell division protein FtsB